MQFNVNGDTLKTEFIDTKGLCNCIKYFKNNPHRVNNQRRDL